MWTIAFSSDSRWDAPEARRRSPNSFHFGRRNAGAVIGDQAPSVRNVGQQPLAQLRCGEHIDGRSHVVIEIHRVELAQVVRLEGGHVSEMVAVNAPVFSPISSHRQVGIGHRGMVGEAIEN